MSIYIFKHNQIKDSMDLNYLYPLRNRLMKRHGNDLEILLSNFEGTTQKIDIERGGTKLVGPYARIKEDVKVFKDPNFNWSDEKAIMNAMADRFDMPSWALYSLECKKELNKRLQKYNDVFFYQTKGCDLHCSYCYVDDFNNNGKLDHGAMYVSLNKILEDFYEEREKRQKLIEEGMKIDSDGKLILECNRLRASGGEPTLVIEQWLELLEKLEKDGMSKEVHLQSDTNLSTGHFIKYLERNGDIPKGILDDVARFPNFSLLASFKGTDPNNFAFNTRSNPKLFEEVFYSFGLYLDAGIDVYPFLYNPIRKQ